MDYYVSSEDGKTFYPVDNGIPDCSNCPFNPFKDEDDKVNYEEE